MSIRSLFSFRSENSFFIPPPPARCVDLRLPTHPKELLLLVPDVLLLLLLHKHVRAEIVARPRQNLPPRHHVAAFAVDRLHGIFRLDLRRWTNTATKQKGRSVN
jgi:hypothetical protein